jgi:chromosome segregation ATPase
MEKMAHAAERVTELGRNYKIDVRNLEKRWRVLKQWSDDYSLELQRIVKEWKAIKQEQDLLVEWLDPNEKQLTKINEKINWADEDGMKKQITDLKVWLCLICENFHDITELSIPGYPLLYGLCPLFKLGEMCL